MAINGRLRQRFGLHGLLVVFVACLAPDSFAMVYYVDCLQGDDQHPGTTAELPWRTIGKVNDSVFYPGDEILFKRGCVWREQLVISSAGELGTPIIFGAYGEGAKPVITGADIIKGWSLDAENVYKAQVSMGVDPNQLYIDGVFYDLCHYPETGYLYSTANSTDGVSIIDSTLAVNREQLIGALAQVRAVDYRIKTLTILDYVPAEHKIILNAEVYAPGSTLFMRSGRGYYLQNKRWMLDSPGEWYFDRQRSELYVYALSSSGMDAHVVEMPTRPYAVFNSGKHFVVIQDLSLKQAVEKDLYVEGASGVEVSDLEVLGGFYGISFYNTNRSVIKNNRVAETLSNGIYVYGSNGNNNEIISGNEVHKAGNVGVCAKNSNGGILFHGTNMNVNNNVVTESGYIGIYMKGSYNLIQNNTIDKSCLVLEDGGGIYTSAPFNTISGNVVKNTMGNSTPVGIYLDDYSHDISVFDNTVINAGYGIFIHTGHDNIVKNNKVYQSRKNGLLINRNTPGSLPGVVKNNVVTHNLFETYGVSEAAAKYYDATGSDDPLGFGEFDYNQYSHPNSKSCISCRYVNYTLPQWKNFSGDDLHSTCAHCSAEPSPPQGLGVSGSSQH